MTFKMRFPREPLGTAQQKGARVIGGRVQFYTKPEIVRLMREYRAELKKHRPAQPFEKPIYLRVVFVYPERKVHKMKTWLSWKTTCPDIDNVLKLLIDTMSAERFWLDDRQVAMLESKKLHAKGQEDFQILITVTELDEDSSSLQEESWEVFHSN